MTFIEARSWWFLIGFLFLVLFIYYLSPILTPFLVAFIIAYLTNPIVNRLVQLKIPRTLAVSLVFIMLFLVILFIAILIVPLLQRQIIILINKIPDILQWVQTQALPRITSRFGIQDAIDFEEVKNFLSEHWTEAGTVATSIWQTVFYSGYTLFGILFNLVMIPVVSFYLLKDWNKIMSGTKNLFPRSVINLWTHLIQQCDEVLGAFFRGQLLVMFSLGIFYSFGLWLIGIDLALLIGVISGLINIVPYLGFIVGIVLAMIASFIQYHQWINMVYAAIVYIIGTTLENTVLTPLLVGDRIGLHPIAVIFAVLAGGQLFGMTGVLLALPVATIVMVLVRYAKDVYLGSYLYSSEY